MRTYKYRLYPSNPQQELLWKHANKLNCIYNYFLNQRIEKYQNDKILIKRKDQQAELVELKKNDNDLKQIHSQVLQQVTLRLDNTYKFFFKKQNGFPKFRSCQNFFGICYPQSGYRIEDNYLITKTYGKIKFIKHRKFKGNTKQIYITNVNNQWFLCITTDYVETNKKNKKKIGIDIGLKNLVVSTDGTKIENCTHSKYFDKQIAKVNQKISKTKKGSRKRKGLRATRRKLYGVKNRKINDFQHKVSRNLSQRYDTIFVENLSVKKMSEGKIKRLNNAIRNAKLSQFITYLEYKVSNVVLVNPMNTSKTCNVCGFLHKDLKLSQRTISCQCGEIYDRDENAAKNVYCLGQAIGQGLCTEKSIIQEALAFRQG